MRDEKKPKSTKTDALRERREAVAAENEERVRRQKSCKHTRTSLSMSGAKTCEACGLVVRSTP